MSGTASIGSLVNDHTPETAAANVKSKTSQRRRIETVRMRSIIAASILGLHLQQFRLEGKGISHGDGLARTKPRHDLHNVIVTLPKDNLALRKPFRCANERDL